MKPSHLIFLCFAALVIFSSAPAAAQKIVLANNSYNVLYAGLSNNIDFAGKNISQKDIRLVPERGKIERWGDRYIYTICTESYGILKFYAYHRKTNKLIDSIEFRLKRIPDPKVYLHAENSKAFVYTGNNLLRDAYGLICYQTDEFTDLNCNVLGFTITVTDSTGNKKDFPFEGIVITEDIKAGLEAIGNKASIEITKVRIVQGCIPEARLVNTNIKLQ